MKHARAAQEIELQLAEAVPLSIGNRSKAGRGYALARSKVQAPVKARPAALHRGMSVNDAFKLVIWATLAHLQANEPGMLAGRDPEYLHQMRVALRRIRSAFGVFAALLPGLAIAPVRNELKWLAANLGPARDWDVFVTETLPLIKAEFGARGGLEAFIARCEILQREANARARRAVRSVRYRHLNLHLAAWLSAESWLTHADPAERAALVEPIAGFASAVIERCYHRVRDKGRKLGALSPAALHRLRIAIKKFRYATDFFSGLYEEKSARDALKRLARLQDILGAMNDAATVADLMANGFDGAAGRRMFVTKGILRGWSRRRAATLRRGLMNAWKEFRSAERFW